MRRASHSRDFEFVPLTASRASTGRHTGRDSAGSVTIPAMTRLFTVPGLVLPTLGPVVEPRRPPRPSCRGGGTGCHRSPPSPAPVRDRPASLPGGPGKAQITGLPPGAGEEIMRPVVRPVRDRPAPVSIPHTVRRPVCAQNPQASAQNVRNDGAVKHGWNQASSTSSEAGKVPSGSIGGIPFSSRCQAPPMLPPAPGTRDQIRAAAAHAACSRPPAPSALTAIPHSHPAPELPGCPQIRRTPKSAESQGKKGRGVTKALPAGSTGGHRSQQKCQPPASGIGQCHDR